MKPKETTYRRPQGAIEEKTTGGFRTGSKPLTQDRKHAWKCGEFITRPDQKCFQVSFDDYIVGVLIDASNVHLYLLFLLLGAKASFTPFKATPAMRDCEPNLRDDQYVFISTCQVEMLNTDFVYFPSIPPLQDSGTPTDFIQNGLFRSDTPERYVNFVKLSGDKIVQCARVLLRMEWLPKFDDPLDITNFTPYKGVYSPKMSDKDRSLIVEFLRVSNTDDAQLKSAIHQRNRLPKRRASVVDLMAPPNWSANPRYLSAPPASYRGTLQYAVLFTCLSGDLHLEWRNGNCIINVGGITIFLGESISNTGINHMLNSINIPMPPTSGGRKMPNQFSIGNSIFCWSFGQFAEQSQVIVRVRGPPVGVRESAPLLTHLSKLVDTDQYVTGERIYFSHYFAPFSENATPTNARIIDNFVATSSPGATTTTVYLCDPKLPVSDDSEYLHSTFQGVVLVFDERIFPIIDGMSVPPYSKFYSDYKEGTTRFVGNNGQVCYQEITPVAKRLDSSNWSFRVKKLGNIILNVTGYEQRKTQTGFVPLTLHLVKEMVDKQTFFNPSGLSNAIVNFLNSMKGEVVSTTWGINQHAVITPCRDFYHPASVPNPFVTMFARGNLVIDNAEPILGHLIETASKIQFISSGRTLVTFVVKSQESNFVIDVRGKTAFVDHQVISYLSHFMKMKHPIHNGNFLVYQLNDANVAISTAACILAFMMAGKAIFSKMKFDNEKMSSVNDWVFSNFSSSLPIMKVIMATSNSGSPVSCLYRAKDTACKKPIAVADNFSQYQKLTIDKKECRILITTVAKLIPSCLVVIPAIVSVPIAFSKVLNPTRFALPLVVGNEFEIACTKCGNLTRTQHILRGCPNEDIRGVPCYSQDNLNLEQFERLYVGSRVPVDCFTFVQSCCKANSRNFQFPFKGIVVSHASPGAARIADGCNFYQNFEAFFRAMILKYKGKDISKLLDIFSGTVPFDKILTILLPGGDEKERKETIRPYVHAFRSIRVGSAFKFPGDKIYIHRRILPKGTPACGQSSKVQTHIPSSNPTLRGRKINSVLKTLYDSKSRKIPYELDYSTLSPDLSIGPEQDSEFSDTQCNNYFSDSGAFETIVKNSKSVPHDCILIDYLEITIKRHTDEPCPKCFNCIFNGEPYSLCFKCTGVPVMTVNVAFTCRRIPGALIFGKRRHRSSFGAPPSLICLPTSFATHIALNQFVSTHKGTVVIVRDGESVSTIPQNVGDRKILISDSLIDKPLDSHEYGEAVLCQLESGDNLLLRSTNRDQLFIDSKLFQTQKPTGLHWSFKIGKPKTLQSLDGSMPKSVFYHYTSDRKIIIAQGAIPMVHVNEDHYSTLFIAGYDGYTPNPEYPCKKTLTVLQNVTCEFTALPTAIIGGYQTRTKTSSVCSICGISGRFEGDCSYHTSMSCETPDYFVEVDVYRLTLNPISQTNDDADEEIKGWTLSFNREHPYQHVSPVTLMKTLKLTVNDDDGNVLSHSLHFGSLAFHSRTVNVHGAHVKGPVVSHNQRTKCVNVAKNETPASGTSLRLARVNDSIKIYIGSESDFEKLCYFDRPDDRFSTITANISMKGKTHVIDTDFFKGTVSSSILLLLEQFKPSNSQDYCSIVNACMVCDPLLVTTQRGKGAESYGNYVYKGTNIQTVPGRSVKPSETYSIAQSDHQDLNQLASSFALSNFSSFSETANLLISGKTIALWDNDPPSPLDEATLIVNSRLPNVVSGKTLEVHVLSMHCRACGGFHDQMDGGNNSLQPSCLKAESSIFGTQYGVTVVVDGFFIDLKFKDAQRGKYPECRVCQKKKPYSCVAIASYRTHQSNEGKWKTYECGVFSSPTRLSGTSTNDSGVCKFIPTSHDGTFSFCIEKYLQDIYVRNPDKSSAQPFVGTGKQRASSSLVQQLRSAKDRIPVAPPAREERDDEDLQVSLGFFDAQSKTRDGYIELANNDSSGDEYEFSYD